MNAPIEAFEFSEFVNPLEKLTRDYTANGGTPAGLDLLQQAAALSTKWDDVAVQNSLLAVRESIRRNVEIDEDEIEHLEELADEVGEESFRDQYLLMELVQAAAVGACGLLSRNVCSGRLAVAAKGFEQFDRAREAYNDAVSGLRILGRFFTVDRMAVELAEERLRDGWNDVRAKSTRRLILLAPATTDPADDWMALLLWESENTAEAGLLQQVDPMLRLALRWEHWFERQSLPLGPAVQGMIRRCDALASGDDWLARRCLITIGDALAEVQEWPEAARVYDHLLDRATEDVTHPLSLHVFAQGAWCHLMAGDLDRCREWLSKFPRASAEALSKNVVTIAAELARYLAVEQLCARKSGQPVSANSQTRISELVRFVSMLISPSPANRTEYLRTLFFTVLARDVESMAERG